MSVTMTMDRLAEMRGCGMPAHWKDTGLGWTGATVEEIAAVLDLAEWALKQKKAAADRLARYRAGKGVPAKKRPAERKPEKKSELRRPTHSGQLHAQAPKSQRGAMKRPKLDPDLARHLHPQLKGTKK